MSDATTKARPEAGVRKVKGTISYIHEMAERPRFYANDHSRDLLDLDPRTVDIEDARSWPVPPDLDREGFMLTPHRSAVTDFRDAAEVARLHPAEIETLLLEVTGADRVVVNGTGVLRFGETSPDAGRLNNSFPARFIHIDCSDKTAAQFAERSRPKDVERPVRWACAYNVWRVLSPPPQDIPLA
ncbi:MAG TPA: CmcJ/NvfI family oxidoreductase, partial [Caulobacteraceae bacterium]